MANNLEPCTEGEYLAFIRAYPRALEADVAGMFDPPLLTHNDFSDGRVWPESVVAAKSCGKSWDGSADAFQILRVPL